MDAKLKECPFCGGEAKECMWLPEGCGTGEVRCLTHGCAMADVEIPIDDWNRRTIALPVAAGSVEDLQKILTGYVLAYQVHSSGASLDSIIAWGAQQRESGKQEALDLTISIGKLRERAEKAEAELAKLQSLLRSQIDHAIFNNHRLPAGMALEGEHAVRVSYIEASIEGAKRIEV